MHHTKFLEMMEARMGEGLRIQTEKGQDYGTADDMLSDFKEDARELGVDPAVIWWVQAKKHWHAITRYAKDGRVESEPIEQRLLDLSNYCFLLLGLIEDARLEEEK